MKSFPETPVTLPQPGGGTWLSTRGGDWALAAALAVACLAVRGAAAARASLSADEGVVGLMSLDILAGKAPSVYWYGQHYMGTLENILAAPWIALLGPTVPAVRMPSVIASAACVFLVYLYMVREAGRGAGITAALMLTVSAAFFHDITMRARGGYGVTLPLVAVMLILASRRGRLSFGGGYLFGLLAGVGMWTNPQTVEVSLPLALWLLVFKRRAAAAAGMAAGAATGLLPVVAYYVSTGVLMRTPPARPGGFIAALSALPRRTLAVLAAGEGAALALRLVTALAAAGFLAAGYVFYVAARVKRRGAHPLDALATTPVAGALVLAATGAYPPARYYYLVYFALAVVASVGWWSLDRRRIAATVLAVALAANATSLAFYTKRANSSDEYLSTAEYAAVIRRLDADGVRSVVTDYGADYALMYLTGLRVKALPVPLGGQWSTRYADALAPVRTADEFAVVLFDQPVHERLKDHMKPEVFEAFLAATGRRADIRRIGRIAIFTHVSDMPHAGSLDEYGRWALENYPALNELQGSLAATGGR